MVIVRKRKAKKTVKRDTPEYGKTYLCGNNYAKLSGLFVTSLNNMTAIGEWREIPYIQKLYGAELIGFCPDPEGTEDSDEFISISPPYEKNPAIDTIYYPVYERKIYSVNVGSENSYLTPISALASDLKWISGEKIKLSVAMSGSVFNSEAEMKFQEKAEGATASTLLSTSNTLTCSGDFILSLTMRGVALSDAIDMAASNLLSEKTSVSSIEILPNRDVGDTTTTRELVGSKYILSGTGDWDDKLSDFYKLACWKTPENGGVVETVLERPLKTAYVLKRDSMGVIEYYRELGYDIPNDFLSRFQNIEDIPAALLTAFPDVPLPSFQCERYETTITPSHDGWYSFCVANDDFSFVFIDDKLVAADVYPDSISLASLVAGISAVNGCPYDVNELSQFVDGEGLDERALVDVRPVAAFAQKTIANISGNILKGDLTGDLKDFSSELTTNFLSSDFFVSNIHLLNNPGNTDVNAEVGYYSYGCWIYLLSCHNYRFRMVHGDTTGGGEQTGIGYILGRTANKIAFAYLDRQEEEQPEEKEIRKWSAKSIDSSKKALESKYFLHANYIPPAQEEDETEPLYNVFSGCKTENKYAKSMDELADGVKWPPDEEPQSDLTAVLDDPNGRWNDLKEQQFIGTATFFQDESLLNKKLLTLFTTRDLTSEEIEEASKNCCYANELYRTQGDVAIALAQTPLCLSGYAGFNRKQTT